MERMTGLDASFLYFETRNMHMHVVAAIVYDPSTVPEGYSFRKIKETIGQRLHLAPRLRRRLAQVPLNVGHPVWVEDEDFDLDYHLHRIAVPAPAGDHETADVVAEILSRPMDRSRPLWEMWIVEGRADGLLAVVSKVHHSTIDGITGANMMAELFDLEPDAPARVAVPDDWEPERRPNDLELLGRAVYDVAARPAGVVKLLPSTLLGLGRIINRRRGGAAGMPAPFTAPRTSFNATLTPHRIVSFVNVSLDDVKTVKNAFGAKVNDVVIAIASGALRRYLAARDELPDRSLIASIPVSVHDRTEDKEGTTKVSFMFASLASDVEDPVKRLRLIAETNEGAKKDHDMVGASFLQDWAEHAAPNTFSLAARMYSSMRLSERHPVVHNLIISNVPGPPIPLYFNGAKLVGLYPLGPIMDGAGLNLTVLSNMDSVGFGFIACRELMPDLWELAEAVPDALAELVAAANAETADRATKPAKRPAARRSAASQTGTR